MKLEPSSWSSRNPPQVGGEDLRNFGTVQSEQSRVSIVLRVNGMSC